VRSNRTIGMSRVQFGELLRRVGELVVWDKKVGRPRALTLAFRAQGYGQIAHCYAGSR
jgi:hypothetical protein